jgi:hypothetical protein
VFISPIHITVLTERVLCMLIQRCGVFGCK